MVEKAAATAPILTAINPLVRRRLRSAAAAAWRPRAKIPTADWCGQHFHLAGEIEATAGQYDLTRRPYWRGVLDAFDDPDCYEVTLCCSTQLGKTLTLLVATNLAAAAQSPAPTMVVTPDRVSCIELRDRIYLNALASPTVRGLVPPVRKWNTRHVDLTSQRIYLAYAGARQRLRGRPCQRVFLTEIDVYRGDSKGGNPNKAARERVKAFRRYKILRESSPMGEDSAIAAALEGSLKHTWQAPCPHCGTWQELRFFPLKAGQHAGRGGLGGLTDAAGNIRDPEEARDHAHYLCLSGCRIDQPDKQDWIMSGQWVPAGQSIEKKTGRLSGQPEKPGRHRGFHLWSIHAETISFGDLAASYLEHRRDGNLPEFFGNWLALPFTPRGKLPPWEQFGRKFSAAHHKGEVPSAAWFLTAGADVQDDRVYFVVRGWGESRRSWLVDWGVLDRVAGDDADLVKSDLAALGRRLLVGAWPVVDEHRRPAANPLGKTSLEVRLAACDSNHRTLDVHALARALASPRFRCVRGDHQVAAGDKYRKSLIERNTRTGEKYDGGLEQWGVYVNHFKQDLAARFLAERNEATWYVTADCVVVGRDYLRQLLNEPKAFAINKQGRSKLEFKAKSHALGVDFWDCEVYASAAAEMIVDALPGRPGWDAARWPKLAAPAGRSAAPREESGGFAARD